MDESFLGKIRSGNWRDVASTLGILIMAPLVALFLTAFVFQSYQVDGPSMETTLQDRDRLIVSKTGRTWSKITRKPYIPKRYEIIVFNQTAEFGQTEATERQLIKRVIGLPGDRVVVKGGEVTIYNNERPNGFAVDKEGPEAKAITTTEAVGGNSDDNEESMIDETVKPGYLYVMGDNRPNSLDSRTFGAIRSQDVVGKLSLRLYPFDKFEHFQ